MLGAFSWLQIIPPVRCIPRAAWYLESGAALSHWLSGNSAAGGRFVLDYPDEHIGSHIENLTRPKPFVKEGKRRGKAKSKAVLKPAVSLFLICLIVTALLAGGQHAHRRPDRRAGCPDRRRFPKGSPAQRRQLRRSGRGHGEKGLDGSGQLAGYVITTEAKGYGGTIEVMTGITADGRNYRRGVFLRAKPRPGRQRH